MKNIPADMVLTLWEKFYQPMRDKEVFDRARIHEKYYNHGKHYQLTLTVDVYNMFATDSNNIKIK